GEKKVIGIEDRDIEKSEVEWSKMESANEHMNKLPGLAEEEKLLIKDNVVKDATRVCRIPLSLHFIQSITKSN
ncbi:hypothetical protein Tco_0362483, partial [Tanacetum coccineum]